MWKSEEMIITIIPLYSRKSVSLVILSLSVETSCWGGGPVVNRDSTLSPQPPFIRNTFEGVTQILKADLKGRDKPG